jgi:hypothetical protein
MSGITGVGVTQNLNSLLQALSGDAYESGISTEELQALRASRMEHRIDEALESAGTDEETADAVKSELKAAFEEILSSEESPPDPAVMKETIDGVFAKFGLDASEILGQPGGPSFNGGGGSPPPPPANDGYADSASSTSDGTKTLIEFLESLDQQGTSPSDAAAMLVDFLFGLDETA